MFSSVYLVHIFRYRKRERERAKSEGERGRNHRADVHWSELWIDVCSFRFLCMHYNRKTLINSKRHNCTSNASFDCIGVFFLLLYRNSSENQSTQKVFSTQWNDYAICCMKWTWNRCVFVSVFYLSIRCVDNPWMSVGAMPSFSYFVNVFSSIYRFSQLYRRACRFQSMHIARIAHLMTVTMAALCTILNYLKIFEVISFMFRV